MNYKATLIVIVINIVPIKSNFQEFLTEQNTLSFIFTLKKSE